MMPKKIESTLSAPAIEKTLTAQPESVPVAEQVSGEPVQQETGDAGADLVANSAKSAGDAAELFIVEKRLGERIKHLRLRKSMGLVELGRHTGLSASFLSQLETGRVVPTLRNLARIAMVFSKDLSYFFEPEPKTLFRVHRGKERVRLPQTGTDEPSYYFESLGYMVPDRQLDPYFAEFLPKVKPRRGHQHPGCEFLYLLEGCLDINHGEATHHLEAGDAVYFDSNTPHSYVCDGSGSAKALIVTLQGQAALQQLANGPLSKPKSATGPQRPRPEPTSPTAPSRPQ